MIGIYNLTTLAAFEDALNKTTSTDDIKLEDILNRATAMLENYTQRKLRARTYGSDGIDSEYQGGKGWSIVQVQNYPLISIDYLYDDVERDWGSATLKTSTDYFISDYGAGIIELAADAVLGTIFRDGRGNIRIDYTGGFDHFYSIDGVNDRIDFEETSGSELTADISGDIYTASGFCTAIKTALEAAGASTYTITYDYYLGTFKLASDLSGGGGTFKILWNSGTNKYRTAGRTLGFDISADDDTAADHTSNYPVLGIPDDLENACLEMAVWLYKQSALGRASLGKKSMSQSNPAGASIQYITDALLPSTKQMLDTYVRIPLT